MAKRTTLVIQAIEANYGFEANEASPSIGHPCGFIAKAQWLKRHPKHSIAVGNYLLNDATFSGDFEGMLLTMILCGCQVSAKVMKHLERWSRMGCPNWMGKLITSNYAAWWASWWKALKSMRGEGDAYEYYCDLAYEELLWFRQKICLMVEGEIYEGNMEQALPFVRELNTTSASWKWMILDEANECFSESNFIPVHWRV